MLIGRIKQLDITCYLGGFNSWIFLVTLEACAIGYFLLSGRMKQLDISVTWEY